MTTNQLTPKLYRCPHCHNLTPIQVHIYNDVYCIPCLEINDTENALHILNHLKDHLLAIKSTIKG